MSSAFIYICWIDIAAAVVLLGSDLCIFLSLWRHFSHLNMSEPADKRSTTFVHRKEKCLVTVAKQDVTHAPLPNTDHYLERSLAQLLPVSTLLQLELERFSGAGLWWLTWPTSLKHSFVPHINSNALRRKRKWIEKKTCIAVRILRMKAVINRDQIQGEKGKMIKVRMEKSETCRHGNEGPAVVPEEDRCMLGHIGTAVSLDTWAHHRLWELCPSTQTTAAQQVMWDMHLEFLGAGWCHRVSHKLEFLSSKILKPTDKLRKSKHVIVFDCPI